MNKLIVIFFLLNILNIYCQLSCSQYTDSTCGGYTSFKLKCHKFVSSCEGIEVDDGCTINDSNQCVKEDGVTLGENEICFNYGVDYKCRRIKDQCTSYIDSDCGGKKGTIIGSLQCTKMSNNANDFCTEIEIDNYCQLNGSNQCVIRSTVTEENFDKKYSCSFNEDKTTCKREAKVCSAQPTKSCGDMMPLDDSKKCKKVQITANSVICKEIEELNGCTVQSDGSCKGTVTPADEDKKCGFDDQITTCEPIPKTCEDYDSENCSEKPVKSDGKTCYKITLGGTPSCEEVEIDEENCEIDNGVCKASGDNPTHECILDVNNYCRKKTCEETAATTLAGCNAIQLSGDITCSGVRDGDGKCKKVTIHENCDIAAENAAIPFDCVDKDLDDEDQICDFTEDKTECKPRPKTCEEYTTDCNDKTTLSPDKTTCYKFTDEEKCKEVKIEEKCRIDNEDQKCKIQSSETSGSCDFDTNKDECNFIPCNEIKVLTKCETTPGCGYYLKDGKGCREVKVGENCQISSGVCSDDGGKTDTMECLFDYEITECKKRNKICSSYFENNCGDIEITQAKQCYKFSNSHYCTEIQVDEKCNVNNGECVERSGATGIPEDKICHFTDDTKTTCKLVDKKCEEYKTQTCKDLTYTNSNKKCFYYSGSCHEVELDNYCTVDQDGYCEEKDDSSLSDTEICDYTDNDSKKECKKRNRVCNELDIDICESYTPINNKFCFKFEGSTRCTELTVEDACQIDSSNQCVAKRKGDACSLDDNNNRCYKTKSGASLLNLKLFSLLILFFIC